MTEVQRQTHVWMEAASVASHTDALMGSSGIAAPRKGQEHITNPLERLRAFSCPIPPSLRVSRGDPGNLKESCCVFSPRYNERFFQPGHNYNKTYGTETGYNETRTNEILVITNTIQKRRRNNE